MKYLFLTILMVVSFVALKAQNLSKYYTSKLQEKGELYFIFPHEGFYSKETGGELEYDMTYINGRDSVTLNFSYKDAHRRKFSTIEFIVGDRTLDSKVKRLFVESEKKEWHYRYSSRFLYKDLVCLFSSLNSPTILIHDIKSRDVKLNIKKGKWKKQSFINKKIFELIDFNN